MFRFVKSEGAEKEILFGRTEEWIDYPEAAAQHVPDWYKKSPRLLYGNEPTMGSPDEDTNLGLKYCIPFLDSLLTGYMALLWQDLLVKRTPSGAEFQWQNGPDMMSGRSGLGFENFPVPAGHGPKQYVWKQPYSVKVPKGYSTLYTHPLNRYDLPFITLSGVHDSDSILPPGNFPFYLRDDFEGIIPKETPIFQIIPFKREDWVGSGSKKVSKDAENRAIQSTTMLSGFYKKKLWKKKSYRIKEADE